MLKVIIPRILDLSITKYFDSLKETFQKETLSLRAKRFWNFRRISIGSDSKETEKKTYIAQTPQGNGISAESGTGITEDEWFYGIIY